MTVIKLVQMWIAMHASLCSNERRTAQGNNRTRVYFTWTDVNTLHPSTRLQRQVLSNTDNETQLKTAVHKRGQQLIE